MTASPARGRKPRQLDIIHDTALAQSPKRSPYLVPGPLLENGGDLSTAAPRKNGGDLSTAAPRKNGGDLSTGCAQAIVAELANGGMRRLDARRKQLGISIAKLCAAANVHPNTYKITGKGITATRVGTYRRLADALKRFGNGGTYRAPPTLLQFFIRHLTVTLAERVGADAKRVLAQSFESENSNDPVWLQASRLRRAAIYITVEGVGVSKAVVGHALGISRQAVFKAVAMAELERDKDVEFDRLMREMIVLSGKDW